LLAALVVLTVAGCGKGTGTSAGDAGKLPNGRTFLSKTVTGHTLVKDSRIRLSFAKNEIEAYAGCNHLSGPARLDGGHLTLESERSMQTQIGCPESLQAQDEWLFDFLTGRPAWRLDGDRLVLTRGNTRIELMDETVANPAEPLQGTKWVLDTIINDTVASSVPNGVTAWIKLGKDGLATGNAGCNDFGGEPSGNYRADDTTISFGDLIATRMACDKDRTAVENAMFGVLRGKVTYAIEGDTLTLTATSGKALRFHAA
jgi:heat shock protein HslJ